MAAFLLRVFDENRIVYTGEFTAPVELGRQQQQEPGPYHRSAVAGGCRLVIAGDAERSMARRQAVITPLEDRKVRVENVSRTTVFDLQGRESLARGAAREVVLPALLTMGKRTVRLEPIVPSPGPEDQTIHRLTGTTPRPGQTEAMTIAPSSLSTPDSSAAGVEPVLLWFQGLMSVLQSAATSTDFFEKAARALVEVVRLDSGRVLLLDGREEWSVQATSVSEGRGLGAPEAPSFGVLRRVLEERRTIWKTPPSENSCSASLAEVAAVVAAPILDHDGRVIGVLYGDRRRRDLDGGEASITKPEALLVELLASGVASGLARVESEKATLAARVRFEQFFTAELARDLAARPDLLEGRDSEVSVLFCDIKGFSSLSEALGPEKTVAWITDVLEVLSRCVQDHDGVLVDYVGDGLMAMWGAPGPQPDHARLACRAALDMLGSLGGLNDRWRGVLDSPMDVGIGINTGIARVGNVGSRRKFKYGPLGNAVNLASRVQGLNRYLKTRLLVTAACRAQLDPSFAARRIGRVRVRNIVEPVDLFELAGPGRTGWDGLRDGYESALAKLEARDFWATAGILGNLLAQHRDDGPSLILIARAIHYLTDTTAAFDPVWTPPGK